MSPSTQRWIWRVVKVVLVLAIFAGVGWTLHRNLNELDTETLAWDPAWLILAGVFYLAGLLPTAVFWSWTLYASRQQPGLPAAFRAYYVSHLGKYVPGKALVPILRAALIRGPGVRTSIAVATVFYETLTVMAAGVILGALALSEVLPVTELTLGLFLGTLFGTVLLAPRVFNWLSRRFRTLENDPIPPLPFKVFLGGLGLGALSWLGLGLSLWATTRAVHTAPLTPEFIVQLTAFIALATVAGFVTPAPGGLGVREWLLMELLSPELGPGHAGIVAILLRVTWIVAELAVAGVLYPAPLLFSKKPATLQP